MRRVWWMKLGVAMGVWSLAACRAPYPQYQPRALEAPIRVTFRAPEAPVRQRTTQERVEQRADGGSLRERVDVVTETTFVRAEHGGYDVSQEVLAFENTHPDPFQSSLAQVLVAEPMRISIAADGSFVRLLNAESLSAAIRDRATSGEAQRLARRFAPELLDEEVRAEWQRRYGVFFGRNIHSGQSFYSLEELPLSEGRLGYVLERTVAGHVEAPEGRLLALSLRCLGSVADKPELRELVGDTRLNPSVECEGQQFFGLTPFRPVSSILTLSAKVEGKGSVQFVSRSGVPARD